jgi:hypothetical protein
VTDDPVARRHLGIDGLPRLVVVGCVAAIVAALILRYPEAFRDANTTARANAALDFMDRQVGGGNSVVPDQRFLVEARGRIPEDGSFTVAVGEHQPGWTDLTAGFTETFAKYFLLPRRYAADAPWILCLACDRSAYPGAEEVWSGEDALSILRRPQ